MITILEFVIAIYIVKFIDKKIFEYKQKKVMRSVFPFAKLD